MPNVPTPRGATGPIAYVRFHGASGKYWGRYSKEVLCEWRDWMIDQSRQDREVWAYFNNDTEAQAIADATADRKSTRLNSITNAQLVCRLLLAKKNHTEIQVVTQQKTRRHQSENHPYEINEQTQ